MIRLGPAEAGKAQAVPDSAVEMESLSPRSQTNRHESQEPANCKRLKRDGGGRNHSLWSPDYINSKPALSQRNPAKALSSKSINIKQSLRLQMPGIHNLPD